MQAFETLAIIPALALVIALGLHLYENAPKFTVAERRMFGIVSVLATAAMGYRFAILRLFQ